ncbi:MFS transporter [Streptomyces canus]|uniref:DHA2 family multidrug resistance protein-like MFS transporter n=1 Tax=Streptomyces canus TaxID=58343 RepID=A0AAW8FLD6_9ACTN|nr:MFS transporter [Streptomyces canus]MDQ0910753.1 DHA2 family multidrug resistance protein-like MFS transporter [Streptomyces canus]MDQ1070774.1 DHA2 family multidrug resistance protein-like MFS transporter [Streptomyces canus]
MTSLTPSRAGARQWLGLAVLLLPVTLMTADLGVLWLATPYLTADLRPSGAEVLWITDIYGFLTAGLLVIMGTLGDRIGRRKLLMAGSAGFVAASLVAAYAPDPETLIMARAVLGVAGAAVLPSTLSLISHMFADPRQRATAIAMWVSALSVGLAVGPIAGGVLLDNWWWGSVFLIGVPVMVPVLGVATVLLPEYRDPAAGRLDLTSVLFFLLAVLPLVYGIKGVAEHGPNATAATAFATGLGFLIVFIRRQNRLETPFLDLRLFRHRAFTGALLTLLLGMTALNGVEYLVPQYLQAVAGKSPLEAGLWLLPGAAGLVTGSQLTPVLARRVRPAYVLFGGLLVSLTGYGTMVVTTGVVPTSTALAVIMFGVAPISVLGTVLAVGSAPPEKAGAAAATGQTAYDLGLALGIAVTGSVAVAVYRGGIPSDAPPEARDTLGAALAAAERLPNGTELVAVAREAFTSGLQTAATVSAGFALVTAALVMTLLRHIPPIPAAAPEEEPAPRGNDRLQDEAPAVPSRPR